MQILAIHFTNPWLLFLLIPTIGVALIPFFRIERKYRYTRNRVCSVVLHCIIMILAVLALAGITFNYTVANDKNEIILLVDVSDSGEEARDTREEFIQNVLLDGRYDNFKIGVVTFGFTQQYAVPMTTDVGGIYDKYLSAELPDIGATDIASALNYTKDLFENPETGKIVLVTDGKETDEDAKSVVRSIAAQGIKIDVAYVKSDYAEGEIQVTDISMPDYHIGANEECTLKITVQSDVDNFVKLELSDNGKVNQDTGVASVEVKKGTQTIELKHTFDSFGLHEISLSAAPETDGLEQNNQFHTYLYVEAFNKVLVLEQYDDSELLNELLSKDNAFEVTVKKITDQDVPMTVDALREYDQVILNNIANGDMPEGFDEQLYSYVNDYGGGLFTTGGSDETGNAHAYNRADMNQTLYQQMLPVQAINYTPPVGVVVIIDRSGSMSTAMDDGTSMLDWAKAGASTCLEALTERDYFGLMTLESDYNVILNLTPVTQRAKILSAIESIDSTAGGTVFTTAIERAGLALRGLKTVDRRHIIIVTDGAPGDGEDKYGPIIQGYYETDGITLSVVGIGVGAGTPAAEKMQNIVTMGHGRLHTVTNSVDLVREMREDLNAPSIKEVNPETFAPIIYNNTSSILRDIERATDSESRRRLTVELDGFYGVKVRPSADLVLVGEYEVPIYAQWKFGKGMVGSFMCDVNGTWSGSFMGDANGQKFLINVINNLMPTENIRSNEIETVLQTENYINRLSVITDLKEGEYLKGTISFESEDGVYEVSMNEVTEGDFRELPCYVTVAMGVANNYSRCNFVARESGIYTVTIIKYDAAGNELADRVIYKEFAYSAEYNVDTEAKDVSVKDNLETVVSRGNGHMIENLDDPWEIFADFITRLPRTFDPRIVIICAIILLFLLDVAVRKFKFKWPHELVRAYKEKKNSENK